MNKITLTIVTVLLFSLGKIEAQEVFGKIVDADHVPIEYATVILQTIDSVYVDGGVTDTLGVFRLKTNNKKNRLIIQHMLFKTRIMELSGVDAGVIVLNKKENMLTEVVVKGERPLVKVDEGKLSYDVEQIGKNKVISNAYESLLQIPGVRDQDGSLTLAGASKVTVILNGKPTTMSGESLMSLLKNTPVSRVEKVEIMYSAPAKYNVRGAAINIVLRDKLKTNGLQGEVNGNFMQRHYAGGSGSGTLLYASDKISMDFLYGADYQKLRKGLNLLSNHYLQNINDTKPVEQYNLGYNKSLTHHVRYGLDYKITADNTLSFSYTGMFTPKVNAFEQSTGNLYNSSTEKNAYNSMHNVDLSYRSSKGFRVGGNYTSYRYKSAQDLFNVFGGTTDNVITSSRQTIDKLELYIDQEHTLPKDWKLNYGAKYSGSWSENNQNINASGSTNLLSNNSHSNLTESTYGAYMGVEKSFTEKLSGTFSIAGEYYKISDFDRWSVFPAAQLTYVSSLTHVFQWAFSSDKAYPSYWELQESVGYLNGYAEIWGNPLLKPSINYSTQFTYILKQKYLFTLYYSHTLDHFAQLAYQSPNEFKIIYQTTNWDYQQSVGINTVIPVNIGQRLNTRITLNGFNMKAKASDFHDISFDRSKWVGYARLDNTFNISSKPSVKLEVSGYYLSEIIQGIYNIQPMWGIDAGIKWVSSNNRLTLGLKANDLFNSYVPDIDVDYKKQNYNMVVRSDNRYISLNLSYKFGGYKAKKYKEINTSRFGETK